MLISPEGEKAIQLANVQEAKIVKLQAELEKLKEFARKVIQDVCWDMYVLDAGDVQEFAEKLGLIKPTTVTEEDDSDFEVGDIIYKFSEILKEGEGNEQQPRRRAEKS